MGNYLARYRGYRDHKTVAEVSVMVYFTPDFRTSFSHPICNIIRQITHANHVLSESEIPVRLYIYCIEELRGFEEDPDSSKRLGDFENAKENLLNTADIGKHLFKQSEVLKNEPDETST